MNLSEQKMVEYRKLNVINEYTKPTSEKRKLMKRNYWKITRKSITRIDTHSKITLLHTKIKSPHRKQREIFLQISICIK